jgi:hypothetical protein
MRTINNNPPKKQKTQQPEPLGFLDEEQRADDDDDDVRDVRGWIGAPWGKLLRWGWVLQPCFSASATEPQQLQRPPPGTKMSCRRRFSSGRPASTTTPTNERYSKPIVRAYVLKRNRTDAGFVDVSATSTAALVLGAEI